MSAQDIKAAVALPRIPRWAWWTIAALAVAGSFAWGWEWLTAVGLASVIIAFLPCAVMCGLGLCMARGRGASCNKAKPGEQPPEGKP